jgi:D-methionine transport system substrate-binding protein
VKRNFWKILVPALLLGLVLLAPVFAGGGKDKDAQVIKIGVVGENKEQWKPIIANLAKEGITVQLIIFGDYVMPNQALADGDIDLNAFQHYAFLNNQIASKGYKISAICDTFISPLGLYSRKIKSLGEIKNGDKIAIPSDPTNGGRSLKILETAGLIKVDPAKGFVPELSDITENRLNIQFVQVEASQTAGLLPDVTAAIINGDHALDHNLNPGRDSIFLETQSQGSGNPYVNIIAARTADKDNPLYKKIVDAYHSNEVRQVFETVYKGVYVPAW